MLTFIQFHIDFPSPTLDNIKRAFPTYTQPDSEQLIRTSFASIRQFHPGCRCIVLTDKHTRLNFGTEFEICRLHLDSTQPMLSRLIAQTEYLASANGHLLFLDSDMLLQSNLEVLFAEPFDIGLTYRFFDPWPYRPWPINGGIFFLHGSQLAKGHQFLHDALTIYRERYSNAAAWGGDQDALRDMVGEADFRSSATYIHSDGRYRILLLPCSRYNFSTPDDIEMSGHYADKLVLHFKGPQKRFLLPYWHKYLCPQNHPALRLSWPSTHGP